MATHLSVITGEPGTVAGYRRTADCTFCGVPTWHPCPVLERHLNWMRMRGLSENTVECRRRFLVRLGMLLPVPVVDATAGHLLAWRASVLVADGTAASYICHVRETFKWLISEGLAEENPALRIPVPKMGRRLPRPMSEEDAMRAVTLAPPRIRPWIVLAGWCGLRACEIAGLRRSSILEDAKPPVMLITSTATKGKNERILPLSAWVISELERANLPKSGFAFPRLDGRPGQCQASLISHYANIYLHEIGIAASLHSLRHRFGSATYAAMHDIRVTQELLGHQSPLTTSGYAAFSNVDATAAVEALATPGHP